MKFLPMPGFANAIRCDEVLKGEKFCLSMAVGGAPILLLIPSWHTLRAALSMVGHADFTHF